MTTNKERAEELLEVFMNSPSHNPAWVLQEVLDKLHNQLSGTNNWEYQSSGEYTYGYDCCLKDIDCIIDELEFL